MTKDTDEAQIITLESLGMSPMAKTPEQEKAEAEESIQAELEGRSKVTEDFTENFLRENEDSELEEEEDNEEASEEEEEEDPKPEGDKEVGNKNLYRETIKELFGEDQVFLQENAEGEEVEVSIDDYDVSAETLKEIIQGKIEQAKSEATEGKISVKGVSDITLDLIDIDLNGGDIRDLLQFKAAYTDPLDRLDLSTENGQMSAIELYLRGKGEKEDEIEMRIETYRSRGILEEKSKEFDKEIRSGIKAHTEKRKEEALQAKAQKEELFKNYRKDLSDELKAGYQMKESTRKNLVDIATKKLDNGEYEIDQLYKASRGNPKDMALLSLFFTNREEFVRHISSEGVTKQRLKDQKAIKLGGSKKAYEVNKKTTKGSDDSNFISLDGLM